MNVLKEVPVALFLCAVVAGNASAIAVSGIERLSAWPTEPYILYPRWLDGDEEIPADFEYGNVGMVSSGASGVYLGNGWVLTAKHVSVGDITLGGVTYSYDGGGSYLIKNPTGIDGIDSYYTDLKLYHLTEEPDLPEIKIATEPPSAGTVVYYVGYGHKQSEEISYWNVDSSGGSYVWTEGTSSSYYWGYTATGPLEFSWGYNQVVRYTETGSVVGSVTLADGTDILGLRTIFNSEDFNGQAVSGDSGGAAFYQDANGDWVLGGIISCVQTLPNSPTLALRDAVTNSVALACYQDQILEIITPEPIAGDANGDGVVDGSDVTILAGNWQQATDLGAAAGDFNGDGVVDGSDVTILAGNWQYGVDVQANLSSVPEPGGWMLLYGLFLVLCLVRKRCCG